MDSRQDRRAGSLEQSSGELRCCYANDIGLLRCAVEPDRPIGTMRVLEELEPAPRVETGDLLITNSPEGIGSRLSPEQLNQQLTELIQSVWTV